jgi:hypothetical protein
MNLVINMILTHCPNRTIMITKYHFDKTILKYYQIAKFFQNFLSFSSNMGKNWYDNWRLF